MAMIYPNTLFTGKNGTPYQLRSPAAADAESMIAYLKATAAETEFLLSCPEELTFTPADEESFLANYAADPGCLMISAFCGEELVGNGSLSCVMDRQKTRHRASVGMAILRSHWGQGLGRKILTELIGCARAAGYEQLELEVADDNHPAICLYESLGFVTYGDRPKSLKRKDGSYYGEMLMVLELD